MAVLSKLWLVRCRLRGCRARDPLWVLLSPIFQISKFEEFFDKCILYYDAFLKPYCSFEVHVMHVVLPHLKCA